MSRGVKWRLEWAFFLGENGRRQYNRLCKGCVHPCKQSFRAVVLDCPHFQSQRVKKGVDKGGKRNQAQTAQIVGAILPHILRDTTTTTTPAA